MEKVSKSISNQGESPVYSTVSIYTNSIAPDLLSELSDLKKIRKGYQSASDSWYYNFTLKNLSAFTGFPALINSAKLCKISVKKYKKNPVEHSWQPAASQVRIVIPLSNVGTYYLQFSQYNNVRLVSGNVYLFTDTDYRITVGKAGVKDFYLLVLACDQV